MDLKKKKILVTGADGFIGSHLTEELVRRGFDIRAFVYYNSFGSWGWLDQSSSDVKKSLEVIAGDIRDGFSDARRFREEYLDAAQRPRGGGDLHRQSVRGEFGRPQLGPRARDGYRRRNTYRLGNGTRTGRARPFS